MKEYNISDQAIFLRIAVISMMGLPLLVFIGGALIDKGAIEYQGYVLLAFMVIAFFSLVYFVLRMPHKLIIDSGNVIFKSVLTRKEISKNEITDIYVNNNSIYFSLPNGKIRMNKSIDGVYELMDISKNRTSKRVQSKEKSELFEEMEFKQSTYSKYVKIVMTFVVIVTMVTVGMLYDQYIFVVLFSIIGVLGIWYSLRLPYLLIVKSDKLIFKSYVRVIEIRIEDLVSITLASYENGEVLTFKHKDGSIGIDNFIPDIYKLIRYLKYRNEKIITKGC